VYVVWAEQSAELARMWQLAFRDVRRAMVVRCAAADFIQVVEPDATVVYMVDLEQRYGDRTVTEYARVLPVHEPGVGLPRQVVTMPGRLWLKLLGNAPERRPEHAPLHLAHQYAYESLQSIFLALRQHNLTSDPPVHRLGIHGDELRTLFRYRGPEDYLIGMARLAYENVMVCEVEAN